MLKIKGLDKLTRELDQLQKALAEVDGELGNVSFNPNDPASIEAAIVASEQMIDDRLGSYASNSTVRSIAADMKEKIREGIIERAAQARLEDDVDPEKQDKDSL